ncbi:MAG: NTF2-like N-terminal transpeptidase domain-containing protein, partial [Anaerolineales bacterium]
MKPYRILPFILMLAILIGCANPGTVPGLPQAGIPEEELPTPVVRVTSAPDPQSALTIFVEAWQEDDFDSMYAMLSAESQQNISLEDFSKRYNDAMNEMALRELKVDVLNTNLGPTSAQSNLRITYTSNVIGDFEREVLFGFRFQNGNWKIDWEEGMILPELRGGNTLSMDYVTTPRGNIYDRNGNVLVEQTEAVAM